MPSVALAKPFVKKLRKRDTSRIVANLALATFDGAVEKDGRIRCYRRYVDDFVIVAQAGDLPIRNIDDALAEFVPHVDRTDTDVALDQNALARPGSDFRIQRGKCKVHHLRGVPGLEFLSSVRKDFARLVSERRSFVDPIVLFGEELASFVRVGPPGRPLTVLRDADRTRLEHFELSTRLRALERVSILVDEESARQLARRVIDEATVFFRGDEDWVGNLDVAFRMLRLGLRMRDRQGTDDLMRYMDRLWLDLERLRSSAGRLFHRDREILQRGALVWLRNYLHERRLEALCSVLRPVGHSSGLPQRLRAGVIERTKTVGWRGLVRRARLLAAADLRTFDREDDAVGENPYEASRQRTELGTDDSGLATRLDRIDEFARRCERQGDVAWTIAARSLFLCTRPPSYFDIAYRVLNGVEEGVPQDAFGDVLQLVNAIRGTQYREPVGEVRNRQTIMIPPHLMGERIWGDPQIILGNLVSRP